MEPVGHILVRDAALHPQRLLTHIQHNLQQILPVSALKLEVDQFAVRPRSEQVYPQVIHLRQFDIQPPQLGRAGEREEQRAAGPGQDVLQRDVVFLQGLSAI